MIAALALWSVAYTGPTSNATARAAFGALHTLGALRNTHDYWCAARHGWLISRRHASVA